MIVRCWELYTEQPPIQKSSAEPRKQAKVSSTSTPKQTITSSTTQKVVKTEQQAVVSRNSVKIPAVETPQHAEKKSKRVRIGWIIPGVFFAFFTLIFVIVGLLEVELLFAAAFLHFCFNVFCAGLFSQEYALYFGTRNGYT